MPEMRDDSAWASRDAGGGKPALVEPAVPLRGAVAPEGRPVGKLPLKLCEACRSSRASRSCRFSRQLPSLNKRLAAP